MPTIGGSVIQNARRVPHREALIAEDRRWTWAELDRAAARAAGVLAAAGVGHGDRVALMSGNTPEMVIAAFATYRLGAIAVPINARLAPPEIGYILRDSGAEVLVVEPSLLSTAASAVQILHSVAQPEVLALGPVESVGWLTDPDAPVEPVAEDQAAESDDAVIVYTSGTTGQPKGVLLDHHRAVWAALAQITSLGLRDGERYLHLPPLYHSGGVVFLNAMVLLAGTNILIPAFDAGEVLETIERERVTALLGVPTMYQFLLRHPAVRDRDLSSWQVGVFGAAPMPPSTVEQLLTDLPGVRFFQQCGQTEAGPTGIYSTMAQVRERPDSSGHLAQPFLEARVVDRSGADVAPGKVGELVFRGEAVMKGYWGQPAATEEALRGGWLHTGDLVELADDGAMRLVDRLKDVIITGGRNVYSAEVEQALASHPDVADCAVVGRPDEDWGETVVAVVTPRPGAEPTLDELREHCRSLVADYKLPRALWLGEVPRNPGGKVLKQRIREHLKASPGSEPGHR